jgi:phage tail sheath gpL-like
MAFVPTNTDLPSSWLVPGVYIQLNLNGSGSGLNSATKRILLLGYKTSSGSAQVDAPIQVFAQSDANTYFGAGSDLARLYAATLSQIGPGTADVFCLPITAPSAGTAAIHQVVFAGTATAAGSVDAWICGYPVSIPVANADTPTVIGDAFAAAVNLNTALPVTASNASGTVNLTYKTKGLTGNDLPRIVNVNGSIGVTASPGTVVFSGTAGSSGTATLTVGGVAISASISNSDTATVSGAALETALAATAGPVTGVNASGTVTLYHVRDRVVHRISVATTATTQTVAASVGTAGDGAPSLTAALATVAAQPAYRLWATCFDDTASLGACAAHIELYANGLYQKDQTLHYGATKSLATSGAVPAATTPTLSSSPRYTANWCVDSPQQAYELAGRSAGIVCVEDYFARNYDGKAMKSDGLIPFLMPAKASRPIPADANSAMFTYHMTPLIVDEFSGTLRIMRGMTTYRGSDQRLWDWSYIQTLGYYRYDMGVFLAQRFSGKSLKLNGDPKTPNVIKIDSIKDAVFERLKLYDDNDLFDGADALKGNIQAAADPIVSGRVNVFIPMRPPVNLHQIGAVGSNV